MDPAVETISKQTEVPVPPSESPTSPPQNPPPRKLPKVLSLILPLLVIGAVFGGWYIRGVSQTKTVNEQITVSPTLSPPTPTPDLYTEATRSATADWKTYTNSKYGFSLKYPAKGEVRDPSCIAEASCPAHIGECGLDIEEMYDENPPGVSIDHLLSITIDPFSGSLAKYLKEKNADGKYDIQNVTVAAADEALKIGKPKPGVTFEGYDPFGITSFLIKKGKNIYSIVGFQSVGHQGCLPEISTSKPADYLPSWDIPASFSFE